MVYSANLTWPNANLAPVRPKVILERSLFKIHHQRKWRTICKPFWCWEDISSTANTKCTGGYVWNVSSLILGNEPAASPSHFPKIDMLNPEPKRTVFGHVFCDSLSGWCKTICKQSPLLFLNLVINQFTFILCLIFHSISPLPANGRSLLRCSSLSRNEECARMSLYLPFGVFIYCFNEGFMCINTRLSRYFPDTSLLIVFNLCEQKIQQLSLTVPFLPSVCFSSSGFERLFCPLYWVYTSSDLTTSPLGCWLPQKQNVHTEMLSVGVYEATVYLSNRLALYVQICPHVLYLYVYLILT